MFWLTQAALFSFDPDDRGKFPERYAISVGSRDRKADTVSRPLAAPPGRLEFKRWWGVQADLNDPTWRRRSAI